MPDKNSTKAAVNGRSASSCSARLVAGQLDDLAHAMRKVGAQLERHGELHCGYALARSQELLGAADMAREWAKKLRVSVKQNT